MQGARGGQGPWAVVTQHPWEAGQACRRQGQWAGTRRAEWPVGDVSEGDSGLCGLVWLDGPSGSSQGHMSLPCELAHRWPGLGH